MLIEPFVVPTLIGNLARLLPGRPVGLRPPADQVRAVALLVRLFAPQLTSYLVPRLIRGLSYLASDVRAVVPAV
jgi:hypothetical protein